MTFPSLSLWYLDKNELDFHFNTGFLFSIFAVHFIVTNSAFFLVFKDYLELYFLLSVNIMLSHSSLCWPPEQLDKYSSKPFPN